MKEQVVGSTRTFVLTKGFTEVSGHSALVGEDNTRRLFAELYADPDRPEVRPREAYQAILSSMQPGWSIRLLQLFWPDPEPRLEFQRQAETWHAPSSEGLDILYQGLLLAVQQYPLPFARRTILEFVLPRDEGIAWWDGLTGFCSSFGIKVHYLNQTAIESLTHWILNPDLEYHPVQADVKNSS
jgi:hypothetical protein